MLQEGEFTVLSLDQCKRFFAKSGFKITKAYFCLNEPTRASCMVSDFFLSLIQHIVKILGNHF